MKWLFCSTFQNYITTNVLNAVSTYRIYGYLPIFFEALIFILLLYYEKVRVWFKFVCFTFYNNSACVLQFLKIILA